MMNMYTMQPGFNHQLLGKAVHISGKDSEGDDFQSGNFVVTSVRPDEIKIVGTNRNLTLYQSDFGQGGLIMNLLSKSERVSPFVGGDETE